MSLISPEEEITYFSSLMELVETWKQFGMTWVLHQRSFSNEKTMLLVHIFQSVLPDTTLFNTTRLYYEPEVLVILIFKIRKLKLRLILSS